MARRKPRAASRSGYRRSYASRSRTASRGRARRSTGYRGRSGASRASSRGTTIRVVLQQPSTAAPVILSDAGRMMGPAGDKRSKY